MPHIVPMMRACGMRRMVRSSPRWDGYCRRRGLRVERTVDREGREWRIFWV